MINEFIKPVNYLMLALGITALLACSPATEHVSRDQSGATHDDTILRWARERHGEHVYDPVETFYGDFTGDGVNDALAWILYPSGGNSEYLHVALFRNEGDVLAYYRSVDGVFGGNPRAVVFKQGRITLTTTMPNPGDPRCCPTGSQDWVIDTN
jgi:hypothetical protein